MLSFEEQHPVVAIRDCPSCCSNSFSIHQEDPWKSADLGQVSRNGDIVTARLAGREALTYISSHRQR